MLGSTTYVHSYSFGVLCYVLHAKKTRIGKEVAKKRKGAAHSRLWSRERGSWDEKTATAGLRQAFLCMRSGNEIG